LLLLLLLLPSLLLQTLNSENMEDYVGYELPAKFLEVDEVRPA
jgi:hypothetical protein